MIEVAVYKKALTNPLSKRKLLMFLMLLLALPVLRAQTHILVRNMGLQNGKAQVEVKWFAQAVVQDRPIYLFRKEVTSKDWVLLSPQPLKVQVEISQVEKLKDKELATFEELIKGRKQKPITGLPLLAVWAKAIQSTAYATYLGIYYRDTTAMLNTTYQYCLRYTTNPFDPQVVISQEVKVQEQPYLIAQVEKFQVVPGRKSVGFLWKPENLRFWAVHIYRKRSDEVAFKRITPKPLMINEYQSTEADKKREFYATDDSLKEGGLYFYKIAGVDFFNQEGIPSAEVPVFIKDKTSPEPVVLKKDSAYKQKVWLSWGNSAAQDLKGYHLYRSKKNEEGYQKITSVPLPSQTLAYTDQPQESGDYYYFVTAMDTALNETPSNKIIANLDDVTPPAKPRGLALKVDTGFIKLSWQANTEKDLWGYYVYRGVPHQSAEAMVLITKRPLKAPQYTDTLNRVVSSRFVYKVTAIDTSFNISEASDTLGGAMPDVIPPDRPYIKSVKVTNGSLEITWLAGNERDLAGFELFMSAVFTAANGQQKTSTFKKNADAASRSITFQSPLQGALTYHIHMTAKDRSGNTSEKSELYTHYSYDTKTAEDDQGKLKLTGTYKKKHKSIVFKWKYEGKAETDQYILYEKDEAGEYRPLTKYMSAHKHELHGISIGAHSYQLRMYLSNGKALRSADIVVERKE